MAHDKYSMCLGHHKRHVEEDKFLRNHHHNSGPLKHQNYVEEALSKILLLAEEEMQCYLETTLRIRHHLHKYRLTLVQGIHFPLFRKQFFLVLIKI